MRLFIGIELSKNTKRSLENIQKELRPMMEEGRFAPKENLHLTLKFLGNCSIEDKNKIIKLLSNKYLVGPFQMEISEIGSFSNRKGRILWAGVSYNPSLLKLFTILDESLNELSFPMEKREYKAHITLARKIKWKEPYGLEFPPIKEQVSSIVLFESRFNGPRVYYKELNRFYLR